MKTEQHIIPPLGGWKEHTVYIVDVAFADTNGIHKSLFYSGFLNEDNTPGNYNQVWNPTYVCKQELHSVYYLKVVGEVMPWPMREKLITPEEIVHDTKET